MPRPPALVPLASAAALALTAVLPTACRHEAAPAAAHAAADAPRFAFAAGDRVCLVGNALAERMQHHGWLETALQLRHPDLGLTFRNLGFGGDEVTVRPRSRGFGTPDEHLARCAATVVFAFFGYNESFAGEAGLVRFRDDLTAWVHHVRHSDYGKGTPRLVLFGPIAHEDLGDPHLADAAAGNRRLQPYAAAMREVADAHQVAFVDLLGDTQMLYAADAEPWTINGVHLNAHGNRRVAELIAAALSPAAAATPDPARVEAVRLAVVDKDDHWFHRYRTTDGYSIFGQRGELEFVDGQTNREVMTRELEILDAMTAARDRVVHARARGDDDAVPDDGQAPPQIAVATNIPGDGPGGSHLFLSGDEAIARMTVADGLRVNLFASEQQFPELVNPNQTAVDPRGRLWVTAWRTYPHWQPGKPRDDKLLILPDDDGDGRADRCITFADDLHNPTGFEFWGGGVLVAQVPYLEFLEDTDGDDRADRRTRLLGGIDSADTHHSINSFVLSPGGSLYMQEGTFHHTGVETPWAAPQRCFNAGVFRYEPRTQRFEVFASYPFANPHGHVFDRWGQHFVTDGTGSQPYWGTAIGVRTEHPRKLGGAPTVYRQRTRPCPGTLILSSSHFPPAMQGDWLVANVIGFRGVLRYRFADDGSGYRATEQEPLLHSSDPNFRPTDLEIGGDGALYFAEWQNPIIGHMQHNLRDPSRDREHGRVYRVTCDGRSLRRHPDLAAAGERELVAALADGDDPVRYRARIELSGRDPAAVQAALAPWLAAIDGDDADAWHHRLEALWLQQQHGAVDRDLLERVLSCPEPRARAAAVRVLCEWRHRLPEPDVLALLAPRAVDEHPRVRLEAVRACSWVGSAPAAELALRASALPLDRHLTYVLREAMLTLRPQWTAAIRAGSFAADERGLAWLLDMVDAEDLAALPRTEAVNQALLTRRGIAAEHRRQALADLAAAAGRTPVGQLLAQLAAGGAPAADDLAAMLGAFPAAELRPHADALDALTAAAGAPAIRAAAWAALLRLDPDGAEAIWTRAAPSAARTIDLLHGIAALGDEAQLPSVLTARVRELVSATRSTAEAAADADTGGVAWRLFVADSFRDVRRETLEAMSPSATGASERIDLREAQGNREPFALLFTATLLVPVDGSYRFFTASDDGSRLYVGDVEVVSNDGPHAVVEKSGDIDLRAGAHPLTVTYFDAGGADHLRVSWQGPGFARREIPPAALRIGDNAALRRAAVAALARLPAEPAVRFADFARVLRSGEATALATDALLSVPAAERPARQAAELAGVAMAAVEATPPGMRDRDEFARLVELTRQLATALPAAEGDTLRNRLTRLSPQVVRLRTVRERMSYDRKEFTVISGLPVRLVLENVDAMQHNLLIVTPGSIPDVGAVADRMGAEGMARGFVPEHPAVLHALPLLNPGETGTLEFTAPSTPGDYGYVCTFPGHWRLMQGTMHVVAAR